MKMVPLGELVELHGRVGWKGYTVADLTDEGPLVLGANDITTDNQLDLSNVKHLTREKYEESPEIFVQKDDILVVKVGSTIGKVGIINKDLGEASINPNCVIVRATKINPYYLYYYMCSPAGYDFLIKNSAASGQPALNQATLRTMQVPVIEDSHQRMIADFLNSINNKIENNKAICDDLEGMAKLLYDYWFVQFDFPDENGKPYKSSGGKMVWSEELNREIPDGWEAKSISDIGELVTDSVSPSAEKDYYHYSIPAFDDTKMPFCESGDNIASNKYLVPENCVLISKLNPQFKRVWMVRKSSHNAICSTEFLPVKTDEDKIAFLYAVLYSDAFSTHLKQKASSSTGSRKRIDPENCISFRFPYNRIIAEKYNSKMIGMFDRTKSLLEENQQLVALRDFLLPMLMNGQVKIGKDGE